MDDDLFRSGPWTGFYNYSGPDDRHRMDLNLTFANGQMSGDGTDNIALFVIEGRYDRATRECWWTKTYPASHDVIYRGFREGVGIWGTWEIPPVSKGGFHIWPKLEGMAEHESLTAEAAKPVDAIATFVTPHWHQDLGDGKSYVERLVRRKTLLTSTVLISHCNCAILIHC